MSDDLLNLNLTPNGINYLKKCGICSVDDLLNEIQNNGWEAFPHDTEHKKMIIDRIQKGLLSNGFYSYVYGDKVIDYSNESDIRECLPPYNLSLLLSSGFGKDEIIYRTDMQEADYEQLLSGQTIKSDFVLRLCSILGCKVSEFVNLEKRATPVPDFNLLELECGDEFQELGYTHYGENVSLSYILGNLLYLRDRFLISENAFVEVVNKLNSLGYKFTVEKILEPNTIRLAKELSENTSVREYQSNRIKRYISWAIHQKLQSEFESSGNNVVGDNSTVKYKRGILHQCSKDSEMQFYPEDNVLFTAQELYPYNLIEDVLGHSCIFVTSVKDDLVLIVKQVMDTLAEHERAAVEYKYKYGYSRIEDHLEHWQLENTAAFATVYREDVLEFTLRKLRHPSRSKHLRCFTASPYCPRTDISDGVYREYVDEIKTVLRTKMEIKPAIGYLPHVLSSFYDEPIIDNIQKSLDLWECIPDVSIDKLGLSGHAYYALKFAGLMSTISIINIHGRGLPLSDMQNSGLHSVYGIEDTQIQEILSVLSNLKLHAFDLSQVDTIVEYCEKLATHGNAPPDIVCVGLSETSIAALLRMRYRCLEEVLSACHYGEIDERLRAINVEAKEKTKLINELKAFYVYRFLAVCKSD